MKKNKKTKLALEIIELENKIAPVDCAEPTSKSICIKGCYNYGAEC